MNQPTSTAVRSTVLATTLALAAMGAALAQTRGGQLRVAAPQLPANPDPVVSTLGTNWMVAQNACEGLFALDDNWAPQPMLARSHAYSNGGKTLTIKLRSGIKFHSGATMTADDVVASLNRFAGSAGTGAVLKGLVSEIKAADAETVVLSLPTPSGMLVGLLTLVPASVFSKAALEGATGTQPVKSLDCTGPYKLSEFQPDRQAVLTRFDAYQSRTEKSSGHAGAKPAWADQILFYPQSEPSVRRDSVLTGKADIAMTLPFDFFNQLKNNPAATPVIVADERSLTVVFNTKQGPAANAKLRQAIQYALTMEPIMRVASTSPDFYEVDPSWVPDRKSMWHSTAGIEGWGKADPERVKKLLAEAGYKGEPLRWLTSKDFYQSQYLPTLAAQQQLEKLGIKIEVLQMPAATYVKTRTEPGGFEMFSSFLPSYVDPVVIPYLNSSFPGFWDNAQKNDLVKQLAAATDPKERVAIWNKIHALIYTEVPFMKFGTESLLFAARKGVSGMSSSPANPQYFANVVPPAAR